MCWSVKERMNQNNKKYVSTFLWPTVVVSPGANFWAKIPNTPTLLSYSHVYAAKSMYAQISSHLYVDYIWILLLIISLLVCHKVIWIFRSVKAGMQFLLWHGLVSLLSRSVYWVVLVWRNEVSPSSKSIVSRYGGALGRWEAACQMEHADNPLGEKKEEQYIRGTDGSM